MGEPGVDEGGPLREFLHLLMGAIASNNSLWRSEEYHRLPSPHLTSLEQQTYKYIGQMISVSQIHGGPSPTFFANCVVDYIVHGLAKVRANVDEVTDETIKANLRQVRFACSVSFIAMLD